MGRSGDGDFGGLLYERVRGLADAGAADYGDWEFGGGLRPRAPSLAMPLLAALGSSSFAEKDIGIDVPTHPPYQN